MWFRPARDFFEAAGIGAGASVRFASADAGAAAGAGAIGAVTEAAAPWMSAAAASRSASDAPTIGGVVTDSIFLPSLAGGLLAPQPMLRREGWQ